MSIYRRPVSTRGVPRSEVVASVYDISIVALGYEQRSRHLALLLNNAPDHRYSVPFAPVSGLSYESNRKALAELRYEEVEVGESQLASWTTGMINHVAKSTDARKLRLCIDISSFTRSRIAHILEGIVLSAADGKSVEADFVYTAAVYRAPPEEQEGATVCGPVSGFFAGWPGDPELPVAAIMGLGYEFEKAIGAYEYLEPASTALVKPTSRDPRYDTEVALANESLFVDRQPAEVFTYPIDDAAECLELVDALVHRYRKDHRVVIVPFGPKLFAISSMVVACANYPRVGVWRISAEHAAAPREQIASDHTTALRVVFE